MSYSLALTHDISQMSNHLEPPTVSGYQAFCFVWKPLLAW